MSTEMLAAVSDLTAVVEEKVVANTHEVRRAVAEVLSVKALLAAKAATESVPEREYRRAWLEQVVTKDTTALRRLVNEYKEVLAAPGASGGYGIPRVTAEAAVAFMGTLCPWTDLCGVEEVTSGDYREPVLLSHTGSVGFEGETDTRDETGRGTWISVAPTWGELPAVFRASTWARDDIPNLEAALVRAVGKQMGVQLALDIWVGDADGNLHGLTHTAPSTTNDAGDNASPNALRAQTALQYVPWAGTSPESLRFSDVENLLNEFAEEYLADPSFALVMRRSTWHAMLAAENIGGTMLTMPRQPTLFGYPVRFCGAMDAIAGTATVFCVAAGAWREGYKLVTRGSMQLTNDQGFSVPGYVEWYARQRWGGIVRDNRAIKLLKAGS